jgi:DNA-binding response OmpR family regulator
MRGVLIIDDDDETRGTLRMILEQEGYPVDEARDAMAGHAVIARCVLTS